MQHGLIKIHRSLQNKGYINKPAYVSLWVNILLLANHDEREFLWNGELVHLKAGQFITGRKELSKLTGIPETTIERILKVFENGHQIGQQKTSKYRLITVRNWDKFQKRTSKRTTNGHQTDTNKKVRIKEYIDETSSSGLLSKTKEVMNWKKISDDYIEDDLQIDPDFKPAQPKKKSGVSDDIQAVFDLFDNPARVTWRLREIERVAAQALFDTYGLDTLKKRLTTIQKLKKQHEDDPYFPLVVTPSQLLDKMESVERYLK